MFSWHKRKNWYVVLLVWLVYCDFCLSFWFSFLILEYSLFVHGCALHALWRHLMLSLLTNKHFPVPLLLGKGVCEIISVNSGFLVMAQSKQRLETHEKWNLWFGSIDLRSAYRQEDVTWLFQSAFHYVTLRHYCFETLQKFCTAFKTEYPTSSIVVIKKSFPNYIK